MAERVSVTFTLNGERRTFTVAAGRRLLDLLRDDAGLSGTKEGCGAGECGACTVLLDGRPVTSCLVLAASVEGRSVVTVEGLGGASGASTCFSGRWSRRAASSAGSAPRVVVTGAAILAQGISEPASGSLLSGNLCRCTGYSKIFEALEAAREGSNG